MSHVIYFSIARGRMKLYYIDKIQKNLHRRIAQKVSNICDPNIDDISGALFTLSLSILKLNSQYEEGTRELNNIWFSAVI